MGLFRGRPLCFGCVGGAAAAFFCAFAGPFASFVCAGAAFVLAVLSALLLRPRGGVDRRVYFTLFFALICAVSLSSALYFSGVEGRATGKEVFVTGYIDTSLSDGESYKATVTNIGGEPVKFDVYADTGSAIPYDHVRFSAYAVLSEVDGYDALYLKGRGIFYRAGLYSLSFNGTEKNFKYHLNSLREYLLSRFYEVSDNGDLFGCLFLGRRDLCPDGIEADFASLGVTHMLAVSGLHVMALLAGLEYAFIRTFGKRRSVFAVLAFAALFYAAVSGFSGSVIRASLMYFIMSSGKAFGRRGDGVTGLFVSAALIFTVCPYAVYDVGFLLSASACLGIILIGAPAARKITEAASGKDALIRGAAYVGASFAVTLTVLAFTVPAAAFGYGKVIFVSLVANLAVSPFLLILLYACPYMLLLSYVPYIGRLAGMLCDGIVEITVRIARLLTALPPAAVSVRYGFVVYLIAVFAAAAFAFALAGVKRRVHYTALCAAFIVSFLCGALISSAVFAEKDVLIIQSSSRGEVIALCSDGECTVYDLSGGSSVYGLADELLKFGVTVADYVCAAPFSSYHVQSVPSACRRLGVRRLVLPDEAGARIAASLYRGEAEYYEQSPGQSAVSDCGRVSVSVFYGLYGGKTRVTASFGDAVYSEAETVTAAETVIYGGHISDPAAASYGAGTVYMPEKYKDQKEINEKTEFYGEIAVIELK